MFEIINLVPELWNVFEATDSSKNKTTVHTLSVDKTL